ncbi:MAG: aldo/keto reductase [Parasporobacterium sp.]|nr:aldo/keto reductase [Parasporobacterium sp.]
MIYKEFQNEQLSALGFGCMRLPCGAGGDPDVDADTTKKMVQYAFDHGVNYFDTAWGYHAGNSETVIGRILSEYPRESFFLADKFPGYDLSNITKVREIFEKQLQKCRVEYFDFYLFHNVCEMNIDAYLDPANGIYEYLMEQKRNGRIRHLGFSCHGHLDVLQRFLEAYGKDMEFCQLQINYLDWNFQDAKAKVEALKEYQIPVWVMEPLRGGSLVSLSEENEARLKALRPGEKVPAWAFRFLQSLPEVTMILSGMSAMDQMEANIRTFEEAKPLNEEEMNTLLDIADHMMKKGTVPCTACRYCTTHCPMELDIPYLISLYNEHLYTGGGFLAPMALMALPDEKKPSACIGCGSCAAVCPQQIQIPDIMSDFAEKLHL